MPRVHSLKIPLQLLSTFTSPTFFAKLDRQLNNNRDRSLGLLSYSSLLLSELLRNYPRIKALVLKLLYRLSLIKSSPLPSESELTSKQLSSAETLKGIYNYIADIRIAANIFGLVPYITQFLQSYSTISKLRKINNRDQFENLSSFLIWAPQIFYENLGFILSHDFLPANFNYFLLPQNRNDSKLSSSDWYYIYSCRIWFFAVLLDVLKNLKSAKVSFTELSDLVLSYHWSTTTGVLSKPVFAIIGFCNALIKFNDSWSNLA